jgi:hypothetical protein
VSSVIIKKDDQVKGVLTDKDMLHYLSDHFSKHFSFSDRVGFPIIDWLNTHGILRISHTLAQIGI